MPHQTQHVCPTTLCAQILQNKHGPRVLACRNLCCCMLLAYNVSVQIMIFLSHPRARLQPHSKSFVKHKNCCSLTEWSVFGHSVDTRGPICPTRVPTTHRALQSAASPSSSPRPQKCAQSASSQKRPTYSACTTQPPTPRL